MRGISTLSGEEISAVRNIINGICPVPDGQFAAFIELLSKKRFAKHAYFIKMGERNDEAGYVVSGLFRLFYIDRKGREYTKNFMLPGHFVAPYNSLLRGEASNLFIQALTDSTALVFDFNAFMKLAEGEICWQTLLRRITEEAYLQKERRESDLLFYDAETRYANFTREYPNLTNAIRQHHIASFLGMSPETLSRIKRRLDISQ